MASPPGAGKAFDSVTRGHDCRSTATTLRARSTERCPVAHVSAVPHAIASAGVSGRRWPVILVFASEHDAQIFAQSPSNPTESLLLERFELLLSPIVTVGQSP
jgi:hypothetical protein